MLLNGSPDIYEQLSHSGALTCCDFAPNPPQNTNRYDTNDQETNQDTNQGNKK